MTDPMLIVFAVLAGTVGLFAWGRPRPDILAILVALVLMFSRVLTPKESLAGFGNQVVILIAAIFIVSEGLVNTGVVHRLGEIVLKWGGGKETRLVVLIMLLVGGVGAFMNTTAIGAMFIPVVLTIAKKTGLNHKRMLMPMSVAALISGMMTLMATSPNMIIESALREHGLAPLGFFSWTPFGLAVLTSAIAFMLVGRRLLSKQLTAQEGGARSLSVYDLIGAYGLTDRLHRLGVSAGSPLIDRSVAQMRHLYSRFGVVIVGVEKHQHGKTQFMPALPETVFEPDDAIFVIVDREQAQQLIETQQLVALPRLDERQRGEALQEIGGTEIMLAPESRLVGKTLGELGFRSRYQVSLLAVRHRGEPLTENLADQRLDFGDTLLIAGGWTDIRRLWDDRENFVVLTVPAEFHEQLPARHRAPVAVAILVAMVAVMAFEFMPHYATVLLAALAMITTGCVKLDAIYRVISWKTVVLIAGMLPLATALTKTGATVLMAHGLVTALGSLGPLAMLAVVFLFTALSAMFISNAATAVLIAPIAIEAAQTLHVSPQAFAMTVAIACSAAFVTPVSAPVNMLVMEPGGYAFGDFVKVGLPLLVLTMLVTVALVALIFLR